MKSTEKLWNKQFPKECFNADTRNFKGAEDFKSSFKYDIVSASKRQQAFFYQVFPKSNVSYNKLIPFFWSEEN